MSSIKKISRVKGWTLAEVEEQLELWKACLKAIAAGQSYTIGGRSLTRANLEQVKETIEYFGDLLEGFETGNPSRIRIRQAVPFD